jgi:hypothetical protein
MILEVCDSLQLLQLLYVFFKLGLVCQKFYLISNNQVRERG